MLEAFRRRLHPDPEVRRFGNHLEHLPRKRTRCYGVADSLQPVLKEFYWKGRDLHSQRRYLALRLRFRGEPYGYMIAHDIHDAVKVSRLPYPPSYHDPLVSIDPLYISIRHSVFNQGGDIT